MNHALLSSASNEWETPEMVFNELDKEFRFQLDAAATPENAKCRRFYTAEDNALLQSWREHVSVWCNPPYGRLVGKFVEKAFREASLGCVVVLLIPSRTDTRWWHDFCAKGEIRFVKGRLGFINRALPTYREDGQFKVSPAPFPSAVVVFRQDNIPKASYLSFTS